MSTSRSRAAAAATEAREGDLFEGVPGGQDPEVDGEEEEEEEEEDESNQPGPSITMQDGTGAADGETEQVVNPQEEDMYGEFSFFQRLRCFSEIDIERYRV